MDFEGVLESKPRTRRIGPKVLTKDDPRVASLRKYGELTEDRIRTIADGIRSGKGLSEIGREIGASSQAISAWRIRGLSEPGSIFAKLAEEMHIAKKDLELKLAPTIPTSAIYGELAKRTPEELEKALASDLIEVARKDRDGKLLLDILSRLYPDRWATKRVIAVNAKFDINRVSKELDERLSRTSRAIQTVQVDSYAIAEGSARPNVSLALLGTSEAAPSAGEVEILDAEDGEAVRED